MKLTVLIVEDEVLIAQTIQLYLQEKGHTIQAICISYTEAIEEYQRQKPDLVLLDIRLYGKESGIDFAHFLLAQKEKTPFIYLTSQYDRRIFDLALQTNPYGYITKPIQKESFWITIETSYNLYQKNNIVEEKNKISLFNGKENSIIALQDIIYLESDHVYTTVFLANQQKIIIRKTLREFLEEVKSELFIRCHRSYIINTNYIKKWDKQNITLENDVQIPVSRANKKLITNTLIK